MDKLRAGASNLGINLTSSQVEQFEAYYHELIDWNQKINLTSVTDYEDVQFKHFLDSLTVASLFEYINNISIIDIGTGAGFHVFSDGTIHLFSF